ncbi:hypothetical protein [Tsukamurella pseudospumae]|uniref:Uncharacterized protein n=1 Tax=Tsukamurella pseudospumae TaxID=239498 RepID=A0A137ZRT6_9ACTN|nr:hypothetical protein [Tsukamurella pseudospumae]KXP00898.1 hypothetical protein AXK61_12885 [Tsukamurella pseudospumae]
MTTIDIPTVTKNVREVLANRPSTRGTELAEAYVAGLNAGPGVKNPHAGKDVLLAQMWRRGWEKATAQRIPGFQALLDEIGDQADEDYDEDLDNGV